MAERWYWLAMLAASTKMGTPWAAEFEDAESTACKLVDSSGPARMAVVTNPPWHTCDICRRPGRMRYPYSMQLDQPSPSKKEQENL
jgi:hypothetical protein